MKTWIKVFFGIIIAICVLALLYVVVNLVKSSGSPGGLKGMPMQDNALEALDSFGFTNPVITGMDFIGCANDDDLGYKFYATNQQGKEVHGSVCCGFFKRCTVRI